MADDNDAKRLLPPSAPQPTAAYIKGLRSNGGSAYANGEEVFKHTKESVLNDVTNTGVMAALIGGFALSAVQSNTTDWEADYVATIDTIIYLLTIFCALVHLLMALRTAVPTEHPGREQDCAMGRAQLDAAYHAHGKVCHGHRGLHLLGAPLILPNS